MHIYWKDKKLTGWRIEPRIKGAAYSFLNHYASSVDANYTLVIVYN
jgi:hypothetical protein